MVKRFKVVVKATQHHERKMSPDELQAHLRMKRTGSSTTKNGRAYRRHNKHKGV